MRANLKFLAMAVVALMSMSACNNEMDEQLPEKGKEMQPVKFEMTLGGSNTRTVTDTDAARTTTWSEGDAVGIFVYEAGTTVAVKKNMKYVLTGEKWVAAASNEIYPEAAYDYYAYYPYQEGADDPTQISLSAKSDQSTTAGVNYGASDVLASQNKDVSANVTTVPLVFKHMFAMVEVKVSGDKVTKQPVKVQLKGVKLDASLDIMAATPVAKAKTNASATDVTMYYLTKTDNATSAPFSFRAVVPAQEIAAETPLVAIYDVDGSGKTYTMQHTAAVPYEVGKFRLLNVNIGTNRVSLEIPKTDLTISPWGTSDAVNGNGSEVVTPITPVETFNLEFPADITAAIAENHKYAAWKTDANNNENSNESYWFRRETNFATPNTTLAIADSKLTLTIAASANWQNSSIGYHYTGTFDRKYFYKVILNVTSNSEDGSSAGSCGFAISNSADNKLFKLAPNNKFEAAAFGSIRANTVNHNETKNLTIYIDFNKAATIGKANGASTTDTDFSDTTGDDVKHVNIYLYNYTRNNKKNTLTINSVSIQKAELIESQIQ